ncbi:MAG: tetratricopeptide repeat protein [Rhodovibrionaceae bacterium]|nr:tetratricopeptide repeat protein [Rhodovibrionaceae bacterium]
MDRNEAIQKAYDLAEGFLATGRYAEAGRLVAAILAEDPQPNHHHLRLILEAVLEADNEPSCAINLAIILLNSETGEHDPERAFALLEGAVDELEEQAKDLSEHSLLGLAHELLADCYITGEGVREEAGAAFRHYQRAAELGRSKAALNVALAHDNGILDQVVDKEEARRFYEMAAERGEPRAMTNLAMLYLTSDIMPPDEVTVMDLLEQARDLGDDTAGEVLQQLRDDVEFDESAIYLNRGAEPET